MTIIVVARDDIHWGFHDGRPRVRSINEVVDLFPAYAHDEALVRECIARTEAAFPIAESYRPTWYLLPFDTTAQTNGWTDFSDEWGWGKDEDGNTLPDLDPSQRPWTSKIVLNGKRIPPHPAVTRYVVAHEYGHVVQRWCERALGYTDRTRHEFLTEYAARRAMTDFGHPGGGEWHRSTGEVFANDFRILVAGAEAEYWPHPDIERPGYVDGLHDWWETAVRDLSRYGAVAT